MKIHSISTGSTGNCYLVEYEPNKVFILDCGISSDTIIKYFLKNKISPMDIKFCLISHLHGDHLYDENFINKYSVHTYFSKKNFKNEIQRKIKPKFFHECHSNEEFTPINEPRIKIKPFKVDHDDYCFGYEITLPDNKKLVYMTDFGNTRDLLPWADNIDYFMIECNYGTDTIEKYISKFNEWDHPAKNQIARRSMSDTGHCSNEDCYAFLKSNPKIKNSNIILLHASGDRLNPKIDYEIFKDLPCKSLNIAGREKVFEYK